jgi:hypothetical protein
VTNRSWTLGWMGSVGTALLMSSLLGPVSGCSKKKQEDTKAQAEKTEADKKKKEQGDRYADGKRLASTLKDWTTRWSETAELPACDPLLKDPAALELCKTAANALTSMKAAAAKPEPEATLIRHAAELAFATENASEKLRAASMEKMQAERKAAPAGSGAAAGKGPMAALSAVPKVRPLASGKTAASGKIADKLKAVESAPVDPAMQVMQAYSRVNRASLRYLSQFLQFGPLPTRNVAFKELEGLAKRKEVWPALGRTLREAAMAENDGELQGKLKALAPKLSRRAPGSAMPGMPPGMPPGHPATPPAGAAPAPAAAAEAPPKAE